MPTVANLAVSVTAQTGDFNRKMQQSAGIVRTFGRTVVNMGKGLAAFGTIAGGVTVGGLALATRHAFKLADAVATTARKVGLATEELIGLRFAAGLAGVKAADLTKHLERMVPKLGTIEDALRSMGVSAGALASMVQVVEALGVSMNQIQSRAIQDAIAAVRRLWTVIKATSFELAARLAPAVKWVAKELLHFVVMARIAVVELAQRLEPFIRSASERLVQFATAGANAGSVVPRSFGLIAEAGAKLANSLAFIEAAWHGLNSVILKVSASMLRAFDVALRGLRIFLAEVVKGIHALGPLLPAGFLPAEWKELLGAAREYEKIAARTQKTIATLAAALTTDAAEATQKMAEAWGKFTAGKAGQDFKAYFADIAERAKAIVAEILKLQKIGLTIPDRPSAGALGGAAARARTAEFQQVSLSRMAVQGVSTPSRPQIVRDPQLATTNDILNRIRFALTLPGLGGVN